MKKTFLILTLVFVGQSAAANADEQYVRDLREKWATRGLKLRTTEPGGQECAEIALTARTVTMLSCYYHDLYNCGKEWGGLASLVMCRPSLRKLEAVEHSAKIAFETCMQEHRDRTK